MKEFLGRGAGNDAACFEQNDARGEEQSFSQIVRDENDGFSETPSQGAEFALQLGTRDGIERAEGLVHQQNGRIDGESTSDADALALAARKFTGAAIGKFRWVKPNQSQELANAHSGAATVPFFERGDERDVFSHSEMGKEASFLDHVTNASPQADGVPSGSGATADQNFPFRGS